jgi:hypothetical protein
MADAVHIGSLISLTRPLRNPIPTTSVIDAKEEFAIDRERLADREQVLGWRD